MSDASDDARLGDTAETDVGSGAGGGSGSGTGGDSASGSGGGSSSRGRRRAAAAAGDEPATASALLEPGQTFGNNYEVRGFLAAGGMSKVWRAHHKGWDRDVAFKIPPEEVCESEDASDLLLKEARRLAQLRHESIAEVLDCGRDPDWSPAPLTYVAMELQEGPTLAKHLRREGPLSLEAAVAILTPLAEALEYAHQQGFVHRDVKPGNVMFTADPAEGGRPKLIDFGLAGKLEDAASRSGVTLSDQEGSSAGTPPYMSPEQINAGKPRASMDVWGLAVVAYEMLADRLPFPSQKLRQQQILEKQPDPVDTDDNGQLDEAQAAGVSEVLFWGLAKDPADRPASPVEFVAALAKVAAGEAFVRPVDGPVAVAPVGVEGAGGAAVGASGVGGPAEAGRSGGGVGRWLGLLLVLAVGVLAADHQLRLGWVLPVRSAPSPVASKPTVVPATPAPSTPVVPPPVSQTPVASASVVPAPVALAPAAPTAVAPTPVAPTRVAPTPPTSAPPTSPPPSSGMVHLDSTPRGAAISFDGLDTGQVTPYTFHSVPPGPRQYQLRLAGYEVSSADLSVSPGKLAKANLFLRPRTTALAIFSDPPGATVTWDGAESGARTPASFDDVALGPHLLALRAIKDSVTWSWSGEVQVEEGRPFVIRRTLEAEDGRLEVTSTPSGAKVFVLTSPDPKRTPRGKDLGKTGEGPTDPLPPGAYTLKLVLAGYDEAEVSATVVAGETRSASVTLRKPAPTHLVDGTRPGEEVTNALGMELCWIPPGSFMMGSPEGEEGSFDSERPQHRVRLSRGFWMGKYEVTQGEYQEVIGSNPSHFQGDSRKPVENVSWKDAQAFCRKLTASEQRAGRLRSDWVYALPSEAQWEYAARAGTTGTRYGALDQVAWSLNNSDVSTKPVGRKAANPWGLHDVLGSVWEWCADPWHSTYTGAPVDGQVWTAGGDSTFRVLRGGSWFSLAQQVRAVFRSSGDPEGQSPGRGFRVLVRPRISADDASSEAAAPQTGRLHVTSTPRGAKVFVLTSPDPNRTPRGKDLGKTGEGPTDSLSPGAYTLKLVLAGYDEAEVSATVVAGETRSASVTLKKPVPTHLVDGTRPGEEFTNSLGMKLCWIPPGSFLMGSPPGEEGSQDDERPQHRVRLALGFWMGKYEVTQGEYQEVVGTNPSRFQGDPRRPVERVRWSEGKEFCQKLTAREQRAGRLDSDWVYALPSEAQWEYAARAGSIGARYGALEQVAWYRDNSGGSSRPVGGKIANPWGLHDVLGNVWEWVEDHHHSSYHGAYGDGAPWVERGVRERDRLNSGNGTFRRVLRGGSWLSSDRNVRAAFRFNVEPGLRDYYGFGLRVIARPTTF